MEQTLKVEKLHYFKCHDCLTAMTLSKKDAFGESYGIREIICGCGGRLEYMGEVFGRGHYGHKEERPACDGRCMGALGPSCDCQCGGANHGRMVLKTVSVIDGKIKIKEFMGEKSVQQANEYRQAVLNAEMSLIVRYGDSLADYKSGKFISNKELWWNIKCAVENLRDAKNLKTHKGRMTRLTALTAMA